MQLDREAARVRAAVYETFVRTGRSPTLDEMGARTELPLAVVRSALDRLAATARHRGARGQVVRGPRNR
jgi:hypothetical protein